MGRAAAAHQAREVAMVPSLRGRGGSMVSRRVPGSRERERVVRAEGLEPSRAIRLHGFSYRLRLSPPGRGALKRMRQVCGLDYPFTVPRKIRGLGAARLVSTPSWSECWMRKNMEHAFQAWLGIAISGFPEFGQFYIAGFPCEHSSFLKSVASAVPPRPRGWSFGAIYHMGQRDVTSVW